MRAPTQTPRRAAAPPSAAPTAATTRPPRPHSRSARSRVGRAPALAAPTSGRRSPSPTRGRGGGARYDLLGLGQAMVDFSAVVDDDFVAAVGATKGGRRLISVDERAELLAALDAASPSVSAGGSAANTVRAVARLAAAGAAARAHPRVTVGWAPVAGADAQGAFHAASMADAGVGVVAQAATVAGDSDGAPHATGTVVVLTTPDAQRTFLAHVEPPPGQLAWAPPVLAAAGRARVLLVEGYLWELPGAETAIAAAVDAARAGGGLVAMTAGDAGVCRRARSTMLRALEAGAADVLFANRAEAAALLGCDDAGPPAHDAAAALGSHVGIAAVTDGANGAALSALGALCVVPPVWGPTPPVDTNGAGDAFAAGALYGLLAGMPVAALGRAGARAAAAVIARTGAALTAAEADRVVAAIGAPSGASPLPQMFLE